MSGYAEANGISQWYDERSARTTKRRLVRRDR